jgi:hypothetical protein
MSYYRGGASNYRPAFPQFLPQITDKKAPNYRIFEKCRIDVANFK